jgi:Tol biopolymer transport system component
MFVAGLVDGGAMHRPALIALCILLPAGRSHSDSYRLYDSAISPNVLSDFQLTRDGTRVVLNSSIGLFSVPVSSGALTKLNSQSGSVINFQIAPNSQRIVYLDNEATFASDELFATSITGGPIVKLNGPLPSPLDIRQSDYGITPNSQHVIYKAFTSQNSLALYSTSLGGGTPIVLNMPSDGFTVGNSAPYPPFYITPDSSRVLYDVRPNITPSELPYSVLSTPVTGGPATTLSEPGVDHAYNGYRITPDGQSAIYGAFVTNIHGELYKAPIDGGPSTLLTSPIDSGSVSFADYLFTPDSSTVVFRGRDGQSDINELFRVSLTGGDPVRLNDPSAGAVKVYDFELTNDGQTVVFVANPNEGTEPAQLFSVPTSGGANTPLTPLRVLSDHKVSPDGKYVVYRSNHVNTSDYELFSVPVAGGETTKLNLPMIANGDVLNFTFTPDGKKVIYSATPNDLSITELFQVSIDGAASIRLNDPLTAGSTILRSTPLKVTPDGRRVVFQFFNGLNRRNELHAAVIVPEPTGRVPVLLSVVAISTIASQQRRQRKPPQPNFGSLALRRAVSEPRNRHRRLSR